MKYDVIIIGAGLAGLMSAHALLQDQKRILVLNAEPVKRSSSAGLVGALAPHMPEHWNAKKEYQFRSMKMAAQFWPEIESVTGLHTGYQRLGRMQWIADDIALEKAKMREAAAQESWHGEARWEVREGQFAPFKNQGLGVIYDDLSAQIFPQNAMKALAQYLRDQGVEIQENERVQRIEAGLVQATQNWQCEDVVIAGGYEAWPFLRSYFGAQFGEGTKGQAALVALEGDWEFPMLTGDGFYVVPHQKRLLGLGSTSERYWHHRRVDGGLDDLLETIKSNVDMPEFQVLKRWSGIRPRAYRPDPLVGEIAPHIFVNAGGFKTGFSFANLLARDLAALMRGEIPSWPINFDVKKHLQ